jgi:hypothetical protein
MQNFCKFENFSSSTSRPQYPVSNKKKKSWQSTYTYVCEQSVCKYGKTFSPISPSLPLTHSPSHTHTLSRTCSLTFSLTLSCSNFLTVYIFCPEQNRMKRKQTLALWLGKYLLDVKNVFRIAMLQSPFSDLICMYTQSTPELGTRPLNDSAYLPVMSSFVRHNVHLASVIASQGDQIWPFRWFFSFASFFILFSEVYSTYFGATFFHRKVMYYFWQKMCLATFWAIYKQTNPVTLLLRNLVSMYLFLEGLSYE